jgi:hypothetical protein
MQNSHLLSSSSVVHPKCKAKQELLYVLSAQLKLGGSTIIVSDVCVDDPLAAWPSCSCTPGPSRYAQLALFPGFEPLDFRLVSRLRV